MNGSCRIWNYTVTRVKFGAVSVPFGPVLVSADIPLLRLA